MTYRLQRFYLIGSDRERRFFRVLKIDRSEPSELNISEDPVVYSPQEIKSLLQRIGEGNRSTGGLNVVAKVYGIVGPKRFRIFLLSHEAVFPHYSRAEIIGVPVTGISLFYSKFLVCFRMHKILRIVLFDCGHKASADRFRMWPRNLQYRGKPDDPCSPLNNTVRRGILQD